MGEVPQLSIKKILTKKSNQLKKNKNSIINKKLIRKQIKYKTFLKIIQEIVNYLE